MRLSRHFGRTLREAPADATLVSHALIVRAAVAQLIAPGVWSYLPLGWRVVQRLASIVREELDATGAQEVRLPILHPAIGEEIIAEMARREVQSYKDLPRTVYQIQVKASDDHRLGGGLGHLRERMVSSVYSLHAATADLDACYDRICRAFRNIFARSDLAVVAVAADCGWPGGGESLAFMLPHPAGADRFAQCRTCGYAADLASAAFLRGEPDGSQPLPLEKLATPDCTTIAGLCKFLGLQPSQTLKAVFYTINSGQPDEQTVLAMLRGDLEVSEAKLARAAGASTIRVATEDEIRARIGAVAGYASPLGLRVREATGSPGAWVIADESLRAMTNFVTGANDAGYHVINANYPRDFTVTQIADIAVAPDGAPCARCGGVLSLEPAIELAHCFRLGSHFTRHAGVAYLDTTGQAQPALMASYQIDLDGLVAGIVETHHDEQGIIWPLEVAPYGVHLVAIAKDEATAQAAESLYTDLQAVGIEVLYDDRNLSPGVMFADADLLGVPLRLTISPRSLESGGIEVKWRWSKERSVLPLTTIAVEVGRMLTGASRTYRPDPS